MDRLFELQSWFKYLYRHGPRFKSYLQHLEQSAHYDAVALERYQNAQLKKMIHHCYHNVPYYQDLFKQLKLTPSDIQGRGDLYKIPLLDKKIVNENFDKLIAQNRQNFLCRNATTSGTTGTPGKFIRDFNSINFENAAVWRHWRTAGDSGKRRVTMRGYSVVPSEQTEPPYWRYNPANRELLMSSFHLSFESSKAYIDEILKFKPEVLYCLPSNAYVLAKFFREHQIDYQFDFIFTSSESLEPDVREFVESIFHGRIFDWYGQAERVAAICQCADGLYHIQEDYSIVELMPVANQSEHFEPVGTHLHNYVMPLLRYRTKDHVVMSPEPCTCGSSFRSVQKIVGRKGNCILTPEGRQITITAHIPCGVNNLLETQFYQDTPGEVTVKILTNGHFTDQDRAQLIKNAKNFTSPLMKITVLEVNHIPRGPNGKFISIVNTMATDNMATAGIQAREKELV